MIVSRIAPVIPGEELRLVTQNDHAALAADLLGLWRRDGLPEHPRRQELLFAAREHDGGWLEADSAPHHDPTSGRPHDFLSLPQALRRELWQRGVERHLEDRPLAALLILRHARALHLSRADDPAWQTLLGTWEELEAETADQLDVPAEEIAADYRWIGLADTLSLAVCAGWDEPFEVLGYRVETAASELALEPFPFAGTTRFRLACRFVPDRVYTSDSDLALELASARWRQIEVLARPLEAR